MLIIQLVSLGKSLPASCHLLLSHLDNRILHKELMPGVVVPPSFRGTTNPAWQYPAAQFIHAAAALPVIRAVDDASQAEDAVHPAHRNPEALTQPGDRHQAHWHILEDIPVSQRTRRLDAVGTRLVVEGHRANSQRTRFFEVTLREY
jgi:hypothetical protein